MSINKNLERAINGSIRHSQAVGQYQRAQQTMLAQIKRVAFDDLLPEHVDEWIASIENTICTLNKMCIELDQRFEAQHEQYQHLPDMQTAPTAQTTH